uniref:Topoisomerase I damage affected protein 4 n=1 Tax=Lygus hesperus TaxID=30085 RepID=A0A0A9XJX6_LYGHE
MSTLFIHIRWILLYIPNQTLFCITEVAFASLFLLVRILWGTYAATVHLFPVFIKITFFNDPIPPPSYIGSVFTLCASLILQLLNMYWGSIILHKIIRVVRQLYLTTNTRKSI